MENIFSFPHGVDWIYVRQYYEGESASKCFIVDINMSSVSMQTTRCLWVGVDKFI